MATIIVNERSKANTLPVIFAQTEAHTGPDIEVLLVTLGRILLGSKEFRDENRTGWITMNRISRLSRKYWKHLPRISMTKADLDMKARVYFEKNSQIDAEEVRVSWKREFTSSSGSHLFIKFERLYPDGTPA